MGLKVANNVSNSIEFGRSFGGYPIHIYIYILFIFIHTYMCTHMCIHMYLSMLHLFVCMYVAACKNLASKGNSFLACWGGSGGFRGSC